MESWGRCEIGSVGRGAGRAESPNGKGLGQHLPAGHRPSVRPSPAQLHSWPPASAGPGAATRGLPAAATRARSQDTVTVPLTLDGHRPPARATSALGMVSTQRIFSHLPCLCRLTTVRRAPPTPVLALAHVSGQPESPDPAPLVPSGSRSGPGTCRAALVCCPTTADARGEGSAGGQAPHPGEPGTYWCCGWRGGSSSRPGTRCG